MNLTLTPHLQKLIDDRVRSGQYASPEDVVIAALLALQNNEHSDDFQPGEWDQLLAQGENSGKPLDGNAVLAELHALRTRPQGKVG